MRDEGYTNYRTEAAVAGLSGKISTDCMLPLYQGKLTAQAALDNAAALVVKEAQA